uniref:WD_REPEATS_REGION domain-containing protein n=1 Tax=Strongyloides papillosus TaxID=174720 RepID=A0A0N5CIL5_STREA
MDETGVSRILKNLTSGHKVKSINIPPLDNFILDVNLEICYQVVFVEESSKVLYTSTKGNDDIKYLSLEDNKYVRFFKGQKEKVLSLSMSFNSKNFLSSSKDGIIKL